MFQYKSWTKHRGSEVVSLTWYPGKISRMYRGACLQGELKPKVVLELAYETNDWDEGFTQHRINLEIGLGVIIHVSTWWTLPWHSKDSLR